MQDHLKFRLLITEFFLKIYFFFSKWKIKEKFNIFFCGLLIFMLKLKIYEIITTWNFSPWFKNELKIFIFLDLSVNSGISGSPLDNANEAKKEIKDEELDQFPDTSLKVEFNRWYKKCILPGNYNFFVGLYDLDTIKGPDQ